MPAAPSSQIIEQVLSAQGPIARALGAEYEPRPQQTQMALAVAGAMEARSHLLAEAGTGVGKSFAYLVPAILRCVNRSETVVVATNTISLQEQLIEKDIPLRARTLGPPAGPGEHASGGDWSWRGPLRPVLVKGRGNYLSIRRLKLASQRQDRLFPDTAARRSLHVIEDWAYTTTDGTLSSLPTLERSAVWESVQSDAGNCMGRKCPNNERCFYQNARRAMTRANLLVCNHALFFSDLALRMAGVGMLPKYDHIVLDEAHNVEDVASEHFGASLSEGRVARLTTSLYHARTNRGFLPQLSLKDGQTAPIDRAIHGVLEADAAARALFDALHRLCRQKPDPAPERPATEDGAASIVRLREPGCVDNTVTQAFRELSLRLKLLKDRAANEADRYELNAFAERAEQIAAAAEVLIAQRLPGCAYWIEVSRPAHQARRLPPRITLACSPIEVAPLLKEHLFDADVSVILTSATLATSKAPTGVIGRDAEVHERCLADDPFDPPAPPSASSRHGFEHVCERLGCEGAAAIQLGSPFDHAKQVELFIDATMPDPRYAARAPRDGPDGRQPKSFAEELAPRILDHVIATEGGAFVLFTSFATLNAVASLLTEPLAELDYPLLVHGRDGSRGIILERFRAKDRSVLFGAASFWQGIDVRGRTLRNVIITRLPFDPPDRPLTEARLERIAERGGNPFMDDSLPRAVMKFKQGFGRLIRSATDTGRVVVLDPRIVKARYGRRFLEALPEGVVIRTL